MDRESVADILPLLKEGSTIECLDEEGNVQKQRRIEGLVEPLSEFGLVVHTMDRQCGELWSIPSLAKRIRQGTARVLVAAVKQVEAISR